MNFKQEFLGETLNLFLKTNIKGVTAGTKKHMDSLAEYLLKPTVTPKNLGLTYATIKYWEAKGYLILSTPKEAEEWRKYSIIEFLWFQILKKLADMGCNLEKIAPQLMFAYANFKTPNSTLLFADTVPPVMVIEGVRVTPFNNFLNHILLTTLSRAKASIQFNQQGCQFYFQKETDKAAIVNEAYAAIFTSGISLCVSDILFTHILGMDNDAQSQLKIFNDQEIEVIKLLKQGDVNQITVKQEGGKIYELQAVEKMDVTGLSSPLNSFITGDYQELQFKTNKNKKIALVRTTKQNFKSN